MVQVKGVFNGHLGVTDPKPAPLRGGQLPQRVQVLLSTSPLLLTDYCFPDEDEGVRGNHMSLCTCGSDFSTPLRNAEAELVSC